MCRDGSVQSAVYVRYAVAQREVHQRCKGFGVVRAQHPEPVLEEVADLVGQPYGDRYHGNGNEGGFPAVLPPYEPDDEQIERQPRDSPRDDEHQAVDGQAAVEVQCEEYGLVEGSHRL